MKGMILYNPRRERLYLYVPGSVFAVQNTGDIKWHFYYKPRTLDKLKRFQMNNGLECLLKKGWELIEKFEADWRLLKIYNEVCY